VLHLPIGLILLLAILETLSFWPRFKKVNANAGLILTITVPAAALTALLGWMLSQSGGYEKELLDLHFRTGMVTAIACFLGGIFFAFGLRKLYRVALAVSVLALTVASHLGGSLTHGSTYLTQYAPQPFRNWLGGSAPAAPAAEGSLTDWKAAPAFQVAAKPMLDKYCIGCHGPEKKKASLRLDTFDALHKGGESGPAFVAGNAAQSLLIKRLHLPSAQDEHMPPDGKPQPTADDIALLEWWINSGADSGKTVAALQPAANIEKLLGARFAKAKPAAPQAAPQPIEAVLPIAEKLSSELNIAIRPLSEHEAWLQCNAGIAGAAFGDEQLARLAPLQSNLRWLDLAGTKVTDAGLAQVAGMVNLERLHLERTGVTDAGLADLQSLAQLEYLNLYGTSVGDDGLEHLKSLPGLRKVFLWQTSVTPAAAKAFVEARTDKDQIRAWEQEIEALAARIRNQKMQVDLGIPVTNAPAASAPVGAAMNTTCPVSGKPIDAEKTVSYEGKVIAFCCDDCKAKFQADPKPWLAKLGLAAPKR